MVQFLDCYVGSFKVGGEVSKIGFVNIKCIMGVVVFFWWSNVLLWIQ